MVIVDLSSDAFQNETDGVACKSVVIYTYCLPVFCPVLAEASQSVGDRSSLVVNSRLPLLL